MDMETGARQYVRLLHSKHCSTCSITEPLRSVREEVRADWCLLGCWLPSGPAWRKDTLQLLLFCFVCAFVCSCVCTRVCVSCVCSVLCECVCACVCVCVSVCVVSVCVCVHVCACVCVACVCVCVRVCVCV